MRRLIIGEADRFPDLAGAWYERGPERGYATLAEEFEELARLGRIRVDDALKAAQHFNWLVLPVAHKRAVFLGAHASMSRREPDWFAAGAVSVFPTAEELGVGRVSVS